MTEYRRTWHPGATWFFTVNLAERRENYPEDWGGENVPSLAAGE
jgi:hypothetical protein